MTRLIFSRHLTHSYSDALEQQIRSTHQGQAYFGGSGPFGATCGECIHLGYFRQHRNKAGDTIKSTHASGCAKFYEFTHKHGPAVPAHAPACRYFERKENGND